jgi:hypothetical protein
MWIDTLGLIFGPWIKKAGALWAPADLQFKV